MNDTEHTTDETAAEQPTKIVIVGGVAGGASAAARARRLSEEAEIVVFERGNHISFANCGMPYHIGGTIEDRDRLLVQTPEKMWSRYRVDVRLRTEVQSIDRDARKVVAENLETGERTTERYDRLILSPGAEPVRPPIPGADADRVFTLRNLDDMDAIKDAVDADDARRAAVIGAGYIGLEMTEALRERGLDVTLVELMDQVFGAADPEMVEPLHRTLEREGVDLRLGTSVTSMRETDDGLEVTLSNGETETVDLAVLGVGVRPESDLAEEAGLETGETGGIVVDEHMRTTDPHIYAVGDAVETRHLVTGRKAQIPLAGPANRQGRVAADNALGRDSTYPGTQGTAICKLFDLTAGITGASEKQLREADMDYEKIYVHPADHASYYPGARQISLKLLFDPGDGSILGAQAVGAKGVDKRIDVLATALRAGEKVQDLQHEELAYAPPYGAAKDPVNYAGFVASNVMSGDMKICHVEDVADPDPDQMLLDVRTPAEVQAGTIPGARNVPIDELRERLDELPRDKEMLVFCKVGLRGYLACRVLEQNGFECRNLTGGYETYRAAKELGSVEELEEEMETDTGETPSSEGEARPATTAPAGSEACPEPSRDIDATCLQCPGPIMRLKSALDGMDDGEAVRIAATDTGFPQDVRSWCHSTGHTLAETGRDDGEFMATIVKSDGAPSQQAERGVRKAQKKSIIVFSGDLDRVMASFIIANGAASMGSDVTMFFTFWGLNVLRRAEKVDVEKGFMEKMFGWMMPRGADKLGLSRMNMGGLGTGMMKGIMNKKGVASLPELIESAQENGVRLVACSMSMDVMGIKKEELLDGIEEGGVATFLDNAEESGTSLFI